MTSTWRAVGGLVATLALAAAAPAVAGPGNGIRFGGSEGRLHPFLDLESRYDSNVYYTDAGRSVGDSILQIRPGFELTVPGSLAAVQLAAELEWAQYLGLSDSSTQDLSKLFGRAVLGLDLNRRGPVGLALDDEFRRGPSTEALVFGTAVVSNYNTLSLGVPWRPGGGALVVSLDGKWVLETFEPYFTGPLCSPTTSTVCDPSTLDRLGYNEVGAGGDVKWMFLPRTTALLEAGWFSRLPNDEAFADAVSGAKGQIGLTGLVTAHVGATVKVGYADTLGSASEGFGTWLATIGGEWLPTDNATVRAGYEHGFGIDPGSPFDVPGTVVAVRRAAVYSRNRLYAGGRILLAARYSLRGDVRWERRAYELAPQTATADVLWIEPAVEAAVSRWMTASLGYTYTSRGTSFPAGSPALPGYSYTKSEAWLRLGFTY